MLIPTYEDDTQNTIIVPTHAVGRLAPDTPESARHAKMVAALFFTAISALMSLGGVWIMAFSFKLLSFEEISPSFLIGVVTTGFFACTGATSGAYFCKQRFCVKVPNRQLTA